MKTTHLLFTLASFFLVFECQHHDTGLLIDTRRIWHGPSIIELLIPYRVPNAAVTRACLQVLTLFHLMSSMQ